MFIQDTMITLCCVNRLPTNLIYQKSALELIMSYMGRYFWRGSPVPLPQWFRYGFDGKLSTMPFFVSWQLYPYRNRCGSGTGTGWDLWDMYLINQENFFFYIWRAFTNTVQKELNINARNYNIIYTLTYIVKLHCSSLNCF